MCQTCQQEPCTCPAPTTEIEEGMPRWAQELREGLTQSFSETVAALRESLTPAPAPAPAPTPAPAPAPIPAPPAELPVVEAVQPAAKPKRRGVLTVRL